MVVREQRDQAWLKEREGLGVALKLVQGSVSFPNPDNCQVQLQADFRFKIDTIQ